MRWECLVAFITAVGPLYNAHVGNRPLLPLRLIVSCQIVAASSTLWCCGMLIFAVMNFILAERLSCISFDSYIIPILLMQKSRQWKDTIFSGTFTLSLLHFNTLRLRYMLQSTRVSFTLNEIMINWRAGVMIQASQLPNLDPFPSYPAASWG